MTHKELQCSDLGDERSGPWRKGLKMHSGLRRSHERQSERYRIGKATAT